MADNKSCEGKLTTLECFSCGFREVFTERQFNFTDGLSCYLCNGPVSPSITKSGETVRNRRMKKVKDYQGVDWASGKDHTAINIRVDCEDALKGLKAVQREAKKTTAVLKELEEQQKKHNTDVIIKTLSDLHNIPEDEIRKSDMKVVINKDCGGDQS
ncbi:hypothetical protein SAMN04487943_101312 [Gracilibacillus orientalis]|uniref:Uncharacterized protein n=1 Tax=Gracilibacillus orientalis TaxID=334253 RepID=A0A1I4H9Y3_9BACI|nr:hypothetical protein [Gracilibacillus orientalis]SFL39088.1 hypothetical protein SAMN04487943_101312 [Gracilibacillus orientalis]